MLERGEGGARAARKQPGPAPLVRAEQAEAPARLPRKPRQQVLQPRFEVVAERVDLVLDHEHALLHRRVAQPQPRRAMARCAAPATPTAPADGFQAAPGEPRQPVEQLVHAEQPVGPPVVVDHVAGRRAAAERGRLASATRASAQPRPANGRLASAARGLHAHGPAAEPAFAAAHRHAQLGNDAAAPALALGKGHQRVLLLAGVVHHHDEAQRGRGLARRQHGRRGVAPFRGVLEPLREAVGHRRGAEVGRALHRRALERRHGVERGEVAPRRCQ